MFFFSDAAVVLLWSDVVPTEMTIGFDWRDDETVVRTRRGEPAFRTEGVPRSNFPLFRSRVLLSCSGCVNRVRQLQYTSCFFLMRKC